LFVNGEFFGLYVVVEDLDESFLDRVYGESKGYLVEFNPQPGYQFDYRGDDPIAYALGDMWEAKTHEDEPELQTLFDMLRTVNEAPDATWFEESGAYVDLKAFMALLAAENYIADADGILSDPWGMNNFYLYRKATDTQFRFLPWDADFGMSWDGREVLHNIPLNVLTRRAYEVPDLRKTYIETMLQAAVVAGGADGWLADEIERVYALIAEDARLDPNKRCLASGRQASCNADDFEAGVEWLRYFADHRYTKIRPELEALMGNPVPEMGAVTTVNAASVTELVPGSLAAVFGSSLARTGGIANESPLPLTLGGTQVSVNGIAAPLLFASPKQINFQVPWNLGEGPATLAISVEGIEGNTLDVEIAPAAPGVLAPLHADFSWVSGGNPVKDDEILVLYVTGLGAVVNPVRDGEAAPLDRLSPTVDPVTATVNGVEAKVLFAGLAPGLAGVYQVNVQMPPIEQPGDWKLVLQQHGVESPAVTLARVIP
jgi:uncharacterized protein (TIGR03437 family)